MPSRAPLCGHREQAAHCCQSMELHPQPTAGLLLGPPRLCLLFQVIKCTVLRSSKPHITRLPHGQESCGGGFPGAVANLLLFPSSSPPPLPCSFSFLRRPYSPASFLPFFVLPCVFPSPESPWGSPVESSWKPQGDLLTASLALIMYKSHSSPFLSWATHSEWEFIRQADKCPAFKPGDRNPGPSLPEILVY